MAGAWIVELERFEDERGSIARAFAVEEFAEHGLDADIVQANVAENPRAGTLRGLHFQLPPHAETKLVRCVRGAVFDVMVDMRVGSDSFGKWFGRELSPSNGLMLYVPKGFAHGYQTLADDSAVYYLATAPYNPESQRGVRWDDETLGIEWPLPDPILSERDARLPILADVT